MKTDIQIAQEATMLPIKDVAANYGITEDDLELYGKYKAKFSDEFMNSLDEKPDGKLVLMTAINPTPAGEGKTTTSIGLAQAFEKLGKKSVLALREPSLGPCFGIKGGAAGGGYSQVVPMEDLNLHFTGDFHAITSANNLLAALLDNHIQQGNELRIDTRQVIWKRCMDMNDRALRNIVIGLGRKVDGYVREDHFVITVATEIMAILCLALVKANLSTSFRKGYFFLRCWLQYVFAFVLDKCFSPFSWRSFCTSSIWLYTKRQQPNVFWHWIFCFSFGYIVYTNALFAISPSPLSIILIVVLTPAYFVEEEECAP